MTGAGLPSLQSLDSPRVAMAGLERSVRALDPGSRALLDLSLRRRLRDDDMAPLLRIDAFNLAWRRARTIERIASGLGLGDPAGLAQVRAALPHLPDTAWAVPLGLGPGPAPPLELEAPGTVEGSAETIEFDAVALQTESAGAPEHAWGPRALAVRPVAPPAAAAQPAPPALPPRIRDAVSMARSAAAARPQAARNFALAAGSALVGALLSRRRR
jgi:hypothetical protein